MSKGHLQKQSRKLSVSPQKSPKPQPNFWPPIAGIAILAYGLYRAIDLRWISDDAFITMRYVKNFVEGNGLVYNIGERVEGYTHFLWLLLLAASKAIGFDPVDASMWLGIAAFAGVLILLLFISFREHKKNPKALWLPIAAALFALNYDTAEWASGGLETSFYTLLILGAFYIWFYSRYSEMRRLLLTGLTLALISLTRPDGVLFTATAVVLLAVMSIRRKQSFPSLSKSIGLLVLPSVVIGVPYLIWKYFYYGDLLPLTYYAKSADENYFGQGFFYIWLYFRVHFTSAIALIVGAFLLLRKKPNEERPNNELHLGSPTITALAAIAVYLILFVARVGGDFMFARFIIPVVPFVYFVIERAMERMQWKRRWQRIGLAVLLLGATLIEEKVPVVPFFHLGDDGKRVENWNLVIVEGTTHWIADERWFYYDHFEIPELQLGTMEMYSEVGKYIEPFFRGLPVTVAIPGAMNMVAYYANFSSAINKYGLTDSFIAHAPMSTRGHIGHEKRATEEYLVRRHVDFELQGVVSKLPDPLHVDGIAFEIPTLGFWQLARLVTYDSSTMDEIARRFEVANNDSRLPLYQLIIPQYIYKLLPGCPLEQLEGAYANFQQFYFNRYPDTALSNRFEERIAELKRDSAAGK
jgi:arabinofuranosyltransferase